MKQNLILPVASTQMVLGKCTNVMICRKQQKSTDKKGKIKNKNKIKREMFSIKASRYSVSSMNK